jgi:hypothetical protein
VFLIELGVAKSGRRDAAGTRARLLRVSVR